MSQGMGISSTGSLGKSVRSPSWGQQQVREIFAQMGKVDIFFLWLLWRCCLLDFASRSFPRNPLISVWFAQGRQNRKRKGIVKSSGLHEPQGTVALWQKVVEQRELASTWSQFTIQGSALLLENPEGASRSKGQNPTGQDDLKCPSQPCFLCFLWC